MKEVNILYCTLPCSTHRSSLVSHLSSHLTRILVHLSNPTSEDFLASLTPAADCRFSPFFVPCRTVPVPATTNKPAIKGKPRSHDLVGNCGDQHCSLYYFTSLFTLIKLVSHPEHSSTPVPTFRHRTILPSTLTSSITFFRHHLS